MPRAKGNGIALTEEQYDWMQKTVKRKAERLKSLEQVVSEKEAKALMGLYNRIMEELPKVDPQTGKILLSFTRAELRVVQKLTKAEHSAMVTKIIPGYQEKLIQASTPEERNRIQEYLDRSVARSQNLVDMLNFTEQKLARLK